MYMCTAEHHDAYRCESSEREVSKVELCQRAQKNSGETSLPAPDAPGNEKQLENGAV